MALARLRAVKGSNIAIVVDRWIDQAGCLDRCIICNETKTCPPAGYSIQLFDPKTEIEGRVIASRPLPCCMALPHAGAFRKAASLEANHELTEPKASLRCHFSTDWAFFFFGLFPKLTSNEPFDL